MKSSTILKAAAAAVIIGALSYAAPAKADPPDDHHDHHAAAADHHDAHHDTHAVVHHDSHHVVHAAPHAVVAHSDHHHHHHVKVVVVQRDRDRLHDYFLHHRRDWCPPGLATWSVGCRPGHGFVVGTVLPPTVQYAILPPEIVTTLSPLPPGYIYVRTGADVYVMNRTDRTIMDAVALMSDLR